MSLTSELRTSVSHYKLARKIVEQVCEANKLDVAAVWSTVSTKEFDYFDKYFRKMKRSNDPFSAVKKPRTAFSFFTQQNRNEIQAKHPNLTFGAVSKLVGEQWRSLDEKSRAKYVALENEDKTRYNTARQQVIDDMATRAGSEPAAAAPVAAASTTTAPAEAAPKKQRAPKPAKSAETSAAPVATPAAQTTASAPAKQSKKSAPKAAATATPATESAPAPAAVAAPAKSAAAPAKQQRSAGGKKH